MKFEVCNGTFYYSENENVFENVCFNVQDGDVLAILGPNGVGKTTLLRCSMGLLKWKKGDTKINDVSIDDIPYRTLWKIIGYVPQAKKAAFSYTADEMVVLGRGAHLGLFEKPHKKDYEIAYEAMHTIGIDYLKGRLCSRMSGGEFQMVLIARALAAEPHILILDEPESNLDYKNQLIILNTISYLSKSKNISCIINTHYPEHAMRIANKSLILKRNRCSTFGETSKIITEKNMKDTFGVNVKIENFSEGGKEYKTVIPISLNKGELYL